VVPTARPEGRAEGFAARPGEHAIGDRAVRDARVTFWVRNVTLWPGSDRTSDGLRSPGASRQDRRFLAVSSCVEQCRDVRETAPCS